MILPEKRFQINQTLIEKQIWINHTLIKLQ